MLQILFFAPEATPNFRNIKKYTIFPALGVIEELVCI